MGFSILDAHPNNECVNLDSSDSWFSFIFCGGHIDRLNLHAYDYYTGEEIASFEKAYESVPVLDPNLKLWNGVGNGVRINIREFVKDASVFSADGEYTWRVELVQDMDSPMRHPDNMVYEGVLPGDPNFLAWVDNIPEIDIDHYLPITPSYKSKIRPPYYVDFLDEKFERTAYDVPITYDEVKTKPDGNQDTVIRLDTYSGVEAGSKLTLRPDIGSKVIVHKKRNFGETVVWQAGDNEIFIDSKISFLNKSDIDDEAIEGAYIKVGDKYFKIEAYDKEKGLVRCANGNELKQYPAGTHYAIYTTRFWSPYYYFRVHTMPKLIINAEFHERRRLKSEVYDTTVNCLDNTCNGILFNAYLHGESHSEVKYHYWDIIDAETGKTVYKTGKIYSQEMECEVFVPFGYKEKVYIGKITIVTQDGITVRGEKEYRIPASPADNNKRFSLRAYQNRFGGIELAWDYNYWYDGTSFLRATDFEVFRVDKRLNKVKYLGKVGFSNYGIEGVTAAASGHNWWLIDHDCDFKLTAPIGAKVNMYLVGGGCDGGGWNVIPNSLNQSFAVGQNGGEGGYFNKKTVICESGVIQGSAKIAKRNDVSGTSLSIGGTVYRCRGEGSQKRGAICSNTMEQTEDYHVVYHNNSESGIDGFATPYGIVCSSGGGGAACGGNKTSGDPEDIPKSIGITGITPKKSGGNWMLIDRESLGGDSGEFELNVPENVKVTMWLVGGGSDGSVWESDPKHGYDEGWSICYPGGGGGYVLEKEIEISGTLKCNAVIADANDNDGTYITIGVDTYRCNDSGCSKTENTKSARSVKYQGKAPESSPAQKGADGNKNSPYGVVGSSGGGGGFDNVYNRESGALGGEGAGNGGIIDEYTAHNGTNAENYGCGGGGGSAKELSKNYLNKNNIVYSKAGKGMPGCIIFRIDDVEAICPAPGHGGVGAGDGGFPKENGDNAVNYGCGGGNAGFYAVDSYGKYTVGDVGLGMQGCVILEVEVNGLKSGITDQVYAVDWTAASDKEYRYIVTGCNYESKYLGEEIQKIDGDPVIFDKRHPPDEMIECSAVVDITPHFDEFYLYFLNDADILRKTEYDHENYYTSLIEPMGRYVTSRNNPYKFVKRHMHTLALERDSKVFYRRHTWRIEGDVEIGNVTHNITRNVSPLYARMPAITIQPTEYDSFSLSFLFGYIDCCACEGDDFAFNDQYMFELWKKCVAEKQTVMIKDPKGNVWVGTFTEHEYEVEYDVYGMPYIINVGFTQTRTENDTLVMIVDEHNKYLKTVENNHLK